MKATKIFTLFACLALVLTACQDDDFGKKYGPAKVGDEIIFGGTAGYEPEGRTVYGDKYPGEGNNLGYTEIKWYTGDKVRIYCAQAQSVTKEQYADYNVVNGLSATESPYGNGYEQTHSSSLSAIGESGLRWGSETETHTFYGVYPAPSQLSASGADELSQQAADKLELNGNTLKGYLPNRQTPVSGKANYTYDSQNRAYTIHPSMRYAYMVANNSVNPSTGYANLTFEPIVTAVEITLKNISYNQVDNNQQDTVSIYNIKSFRISSDKVICGEFSTNIESRENTALSTDDTYKQIFIPTDIKTLYNGESVTFTAFLMLDKSVTGLNDLTVSIITESAQKSAKVNSKNTNGLIVEAKKKNFLNNIPLNLGSRTSHLNAKNWIKYIPNPLGGTDILVKELSIPGAGGAASGNKKDGSYVIADETSRQQNISISEQWAQGVRCFEFAVDISQENMANEPVICNGKQTGLTLDNAVQQVKNCLLNSPDEFAMVIVTYQNTEGFMPYESSGRKPQTFMTRLANYWSSLGDNWQLPEGVEKTHTNTMGPALFNTSLKVSDARGKLYCIARPTSEYEDDYDNAPEEGEVVYKNSDYPTYDKNKLTVINTNSNIFIINGWGSLKDKWQARGYTHSVFYRGKAGYGYGGNVTYAPLYNSNDKGRPFDTATMDGDGDNAPTASNYSANTTENSSNFYYATQVGTGEKTDSTAWVQEWARVSPNVGVTAEYDDDDDLSSYYSIYWAPTIQEKELRISETLNYALAKTKGDIIYINSLCGYFIDSNIPVSIVPNSNTDFSGSRCNRYGIESNILTNYWRVHTLSANNPQSGMAGDIDTYSKYINNYFYKLISDKQSNGELNSGIGIVLMDRVSNSAETDPAGYYIPQIIWSNNTFN